MEDNSFPTSGSPVPAQWMHLFTQYGLKEEDIDYYIKEWNVHNVAHKFPKLAAFFMQSSKKEVIDRTTHVDLNIRDKEADTYEDWGWFCGFIG